jgi:hypothetical protein
MAPRTKVKPNAFAMLQNPTKTDDYLAEGFLNFIDLRIRTFFVTAAHRSTRSPDLRKGSENSRSSAGFVVVQSISTPSSFEEEEERGGGGEEDFASWTRHWSSCSTIFSTSLEMLSRCDALQCFLALV